MIDDVFNHDGIQMDPSWCSEAAPSSTRTISRPRFTTETTVRISRTIGDNERMRDVHEEVARRPTCALPPKTSPAGTTSTTRRATASPTTTTTRTTRPLIDGWSYNWLFFDKRELTFPFGNVYWVTFGGQSPDRRSITPRGRQARRGVGRDDTTTNWMRIDGRLTTQVNRFHAVRLRLQRRRQFLDRSGRTAIRDSFTLPLCPGCFTAGGPPPRAFANLGDISRSDSWTFSINQAPHLGYLDPERTDSFTWNWNKWRTAYTETTVLVERRFNIYGQTNAWDFSRP